jgi:hypothetical protein
MNVVLNYSWNGSAPNHLAVEEIVVHVGFKVLEVVESDSNLVIVKTAHYDAIL